MNVYGDAWQCDVDVDDDHDHDHYKDEDEEDTLPCDDGELVD